MSEFLHSELAFSQYIAPLMADFTTVNSSDSFVRFFDNGVPVNRSRSISFVIFHRRTLELVVA